MASCAKRGKHWGDEFERLIAHQAAVSGMLLVTHGLQARYIGRGKIIGVKSDLDMRVHHQGQTVFFDAKSRAGSTLPLSSLDMRQRALAATYVRHGLSAGFLAHLRGPDAVVWYSHADVLRIGQRGSLGVCDGTLLGDSRAFALALMFAPSGGSDGLT